jgi:YbbR domain-containing protein
MSQSVKTWIQSLLAPAQVRRMEDEASEHKGGIITLCILAACILWFAFSMQENYIQVLEFPTRVVNLPSDKALAAVPPSKVRIQLQGEGIQILRLYYNPPTVPIDVSNRQIDLGLAAPEIIKNVSVQAITPRMVTLAVEDRVTRKVPVHPRINLTFEPGYRMIGRLTTEPDSIAISGARSIVEGVDAWPTQTRNLGAMRDSLHAPVALSDSLGSLLVKEVSEVTVRADIQAFTEARRMVAVRAVGLPAGVAVTFEPAMVEVIYQVPLSQYDAVMEAENFYAFVPYDDILRDTQGRVFPMLHLPDGLEVRSPRFEPESLRYYDVRQDD